MQHILSFKTAIPRLVRFIALLALLLSASNIGAQTHYVPRMSVGAHAGATLGEVGFSPSVRQKFLPGFTIGASMRWAEERHVGLVAELNFTQRGWSERFDNNDLSYSRRLTYVELPVMTHIFFGSRRVNCFFNLGPQIGYMIGSSVSADFDYQHPTAVTGFPANRQTAQMNMPVKNRFDYGITAGIGMEIYLTPRHSIFLQARYYYGLGNIFPSSKSDTFSSSRTNMISATAGYFFRLK